MIGIWDATDISPSRIPSVAAKPSISGICTSIKTRSKLCPASSARASFPLPAITRECPIFCKRRAATAWSTRLSSVSRIRRPRRGVFSSRGDAFDLNSGWLIRGETVSVGRENCRQQFTSSHRFVEKRDDAKLAAAFCIAPAATRAQHHRGNRSDCRPTPDFLDKRNAVHLRHMHVRQQDMVGVSHLRSQSRFRQGLFRAGDTCNPDPPAFESSLQYPTARRVIVDHQDLHAV